MVYPTETGTEPDRIVSHYLSHSYSIQHGTDYKKLIRRLDSERELSLRRHRTRTTKYNRLVHKFRHRSTRLCVRTQVHYQIQWNNVMQRPLRRSRSFKVTDFGSNRKLIFDFLLVININYTFYLAPFPRYKERYCLQQVQNRYILATPLAFNLRRRDYPGTISVKFLPKGQRWPRYRNVVETLPKISIAWLGCTNVLDRQTDDRRTDGRW